MTCYRCGISHNLWNWGSLFLCGPCSDGLVDWIADRKDPAQWWGSVAA